MIACPEDAVITTSNLGTTGDCEGQYAWSHPTPTDNCGIATYTVTYTNADGNIDGPYDVFQIVGGYDDVNANYDFELGVTTAEYIVVDVNGNSMSCSFTVTVTDDENPTRSDA